MYLWFVGCKLPKVVSKCAQKKLKYYQELDLKNLVYPVKTPSEHDVRINVFHSSVVMAKLDGQNIFKGVVQAEEDVRAAFPFRYEAQSQHPAKPKPIGSPQ